MEYLPYVVQAVPGDDFTVYVYYSDGSVRLADIKPLIERGGVFSQLADKDFFVDRLTVMNGAVAWDRGCFGKDGRAYWQCACY